MATVGLIKRMVRFFSETLMPGGSFDVDQEQAKKLLDDLMERQEDRGRLLSEVREAETELLGAMVGYSETWFRYLDEWDRLCIVRDRQHMQHPPT